MLDGTTSVAGINSRSFAADDAGIICEPGSIYTILDKYSSSIAANSGGSSCDSGAGGTNTSCSPVGSPAGCTCNVERNRVSGSASSSPWGSPRLLRDAVEARDDSAASDAEHDRCDACHRRRVRRVSFESTCRDGAPATCGDARSGRAQFAELAASNNAFGLDLFARLREQKGNQPFSPFNVAIGLRMVWAGARGETALEMQRSFTSTARWSRRRRSPAGSSSYQDPGLGVTLRLASRLFGATTYDFNRDYLDSMGSGYGAPLERLDLQAQARRAVRDQSWAASATEDSHQGPLPARRLRPGHAPRPERRDSFLRTGNHHSAWEPPSPHRFTWRRTTPKMSP